MAGPVWPEVVARKTAAKPTSDLSTRCPLKSRLVKGKFFFSLLLRWDRSGDFSISTHNRASLTLTWPIGQSWLRLLFVPIGFPRSQTEFGNERRPRPPGVFEAVHDLEHAAGRLPGRFSASGHGLLLPSRTFADAAFSQGRPGCKGSGAGTNRLPGFAGSCGPRIGNPGEDLRRAPGGFRRGMRFRCTTRLARQSPDQPNQWADREFRVQAARGG